MFSVRHRLRRRRQSSLRFAPLWKRLRKNSFTTLGRQPRKMDFQTAGVADGIAVYLPFVFLVHAGFSLAKCRFGVLLGKVYHPDGMAGKVIW